jgi:hypothetical protein
MDEIYRNARRVRICLGEYPNAFLATWLIRVINISAGDQSFLSTIQLIINASILKYLRTSVSELLELLCHPWFERVWVIQEVIVASAITVQYGYMTLSWPELHRFALLVDSPNSPLVRLLSLNPTVLHNLKKSIIFPRHIFLLEHYRSQFRPEKRLPFCEILERFSNHDATWSIDKIFAVLGLTDAVQKKDDFIDYGARETITMVKVAKYIHERGQLMEVLPFAGIGWGVHDPNLPSWVVDWRLRRDFYMLCEPSLYNATKSKAAKEVYISTNGTILTLFGHVIDKIKAVGPISPTTKDMAARLSPTTVDPKDTIMLDWYNASMKILTDNGAPETYYHHEKQHLSEVFLRTIIGDTSRTPSATTCPANREAIQASERYFEMFKVQDHLVEDSASIDSSHSEPAGFRTKEEIEKISKDYTRLTRPIWMGVDFKRKVCVTKDGYVGLVPTFAEPEDLICVLFGICVPLVLRTSKSKPSKYQLIGESYVHGMMDGEIFSIREHVDRFTIV